MANRQEWEGLVSFLVLAGLGWWWWSNHNKPEHIVPPVAAPAVSPDNTVAPTAPSFPASVQPPLPPSHHYNFREGDVYGYVAAVSEDAQKRGQVAGDVVMFRYAGFSGGQFHLEQLNAQKEVIGSATCAKPCVAIKSDIEGHVERIAYNPDSIIGAAFDDAMNGQLRPKRRAVMEPESGAQMSAGASNGPSEGTSNETTE